MTRLLSFVLVLALTTGCNGSPKPAPEEVRSALDQAWASFDACMMGEPLRTNETYNDRFGWNRTQPLWPHACAPYSQRVSRLLYLADVGELDERYAMLRDLLGSRSGTGAFSAVSDPAGAWAVAEALELGEGSTPDPDVWRPAPLPELAPLEHSDEQTFAHGFVGLERSDPPRIWTRSGVCAVQEGRVRCTATTEPAPEPVARVDCPLRSGPMSLQTSAQEDGEIAIQVTHRGATHHATLPLRRRYGADSVDCLPDGIAWTQVTHFRVARSLSPTLNPVRVRLDQLECNVDGCSSSSTTVPLTLGGVNRDGRAAVARMGDATVIAYQAFRGDIRVRVAPFEALGSARDIVVIRPRWPPVPTDMMLGELRVFVDDGVIYLIMTDAHQDLRLIAIDPGGSFRAVLPEPD